MSTLKNQKMRIAEERKENNMKFHSKVRELRKEEYALNMRIRTTIADIVPTERRNAIPASQLITKISPEYMSKKEFIAYLSNYCNKPHIVITKSTGERCRLCSNKQRVTKYFQEYDENGRKIGGLIERHSWINVYYLIKL